MEHLSKKTKETELKDKYEKLLKEHRKNVEKLKDPEYKQNIERIQKDMEKKIEDVLKRGVPLRGVSL